MHSLFLSLPCFVSIHSIICDRTLISKDSWNLALCGTFLRRQILCHLFQDNKLEFQSEQDGVKIIPYALPIPAMTWHKNPVISKELQEGSSGHWVHTKHHQAFWPWQWGTYKWKKTRTVGVIIQVKCDTNQGILNQFSLLVAFPAISYNHKGLQTLLSLLLKYSHQKR